MRKATLLLIASLVVIGTAGIGVLIACTMVDQEQPVVDFAALPLAIGGNSEQELAQTFTAGSTGLLCGVELSLICSSADSSGEITVAIFDAMAGKPGPNMLVEKTVLAASIPPATVVDPLSALFAFDVPLMVDQDTVYTIVITIDPQGAGTTPCGLNQGPLGDSYAGGDGFFTALPNDPNTWLCVCDFANSRNDFPFRTLMDTPVQTENVSWGRLKASHR